jgi:hypothetical protein
MVKNQCSEGTMVKNQCSEGDLGFAVLNPGVQGGSGQVRSGQVRLGQVLLIWNEPTENPFVGIGTKITRLLDWCQIKSSKRLDFARFETEIRTLNLVM